MISKWDYLVKGSNYEGSLVDKLAQMLIDTERSSKDIMFWNKRLRAKIKELETELAELKAVN
jgi:hypothetical protein